jgi:8-oxo-dGTP pyrophosphatase MutT (NUDIX family)
MSVVLKYYDGHSTASSLEKEVSYDEVMKLDYKTHVKSITIHINSMTKEANDSIREKKQSRTDGDIIIVGEYDGQSFPEFGFAILAKLNPVKITFNGIRFEHKCVRENVFYDLLTVVYNRCVFASVRACIFGYSVTLSSCTLVDLDATTEEDLTLSTNVTDSLIITNENDIPTRYIPIMFPRLKHLSIDTRPSSRPIDFHGVSKCYQLKSLSISKASPIDRRSIPASTVDHMTALSSIKLQLDDRYLSSLLAKKLITMQGLYECLEFAVMPNAFTALDLLENLDLRFAEKIHLDIWDPVVPSDFLIRIMSGDATPKRVTIDFMVQPKMPLQIPDLSRLYNRGSKLSISRSSSTMFRIYAFFGEEQFPGHVFDQIQLSSLTCSDEIPEWMAPIYRDYEMYMPRRVPVATIPPEIYKMITDRGGVAAIRGQRLPKRRLSELAGLVGDGGEGREMSTVTFRPHTEGRIRNVNTYTDEHDAEFQAQFARHVGVDYTDADPRIPEIFRELYIWIKNLPENDKKSIFYYTSGHSSRKINQVLAGKGGAGNLSPHQLAYLKTLLRVYARAPPVRTAFRVFRGFPHDLDGGIFSSTSINKEIAQKFLIDSSVKQTGDYVKNPLGVKIGKCCMHVIEVKPGARVLFFPGGMKQIAEYDEAEVLIAPFMGQFVRSRTTTNDGGSHTMYWTYEPYSDEMISRNLELFESENRPPPQIRKSSRIAGQETVGRAVALNMRHPAGFHKGSEVVITKPHVPTDRTTYRNPHEIATFVPNQMDVPRDALSDSEPFLRVIPQTAFAYLYKRNVDTLTGQVPFVDSRITPDTKLRWGAGLVIFEPDGRVWIAHPTNGFGGDKATFPRGTYDDMDMADLRATAIREVFEETGIMAAIVSYDADALVSIDDDETRAFWTRELTGSGVFAEINQDGYKRVRYYLARRVAGSPVGTGWESQAVSLVPVNKLRELKVGTRFFDDNTERPNDDNHLNEFLLDATVQARIMQSYGAGYFTTAPVITTTAVVDEVSLVSFGTFLRRYKHAHQEDNHAEYRAKLKYNKALHLFFNKH